MSFYADLHIHSKYSRATSRDLDFFHLALWAKKKGITVVGTGDFTHPAWMQAIREELVPAEPGLFRLRDDLEAAVAAELGPTPVAHAPVRFLLEVEISTIYKQGDKVRKVHHLLYAPDLASADRMVGRLARIGNLASDGRPILGLNSRDLLEICLSAGEGCYLIPAHIWTPWFSVFGSKSGCDTLEECYGDLASHIFALETGLSSDPPMNWRISMLDRFQLISNSDAHSPANLGREASRFDCALDYFALRDALATGKGYGGSVEFFPEEGKYHLDGHRACQFRCTPEESKQLGGKCPVCGQPLTLGVDYRVNELADRTEPQKPAGAAPFRSLVPLAEMLSEICQSGAKSKTVQQRYEQLVAKVGSELDILADAPLDAIESAGPPLLVEGLRRMRAGEVIREGGYDGEYGVIRVFQPDELESGKSVGVLFDLPAAVKREASKPKQKKDLVTETTEETQRDTEPQSVSGNSSVHSVSSSSASVSPLLGGLDPDQRAAAEIVAGPLLIVAGPGTGKTRTLTHRIAHLIADHGVAPEACLTITFTRRAAGEMRERLVHLLPDKRGERVPVTTFHALALRILREHEPKLELGAPLRVAAEAEAVTIVREALGLSAAEAQRLVAEALRFRPTTERNAVPPPSHETLREVLRARGCVTFDALVPLALELLTAHPDIAASCRPRWRHLSVDEYQDVDATQYQLVHLLADVVAEPLSAPDGTEAVPLRSLCAIGDPDQAIYGFRGTDVRFFQQFRDDHPDARIVQLTRNYRSSPAIVGAALQAVAPATLVRDRVLRAQSRDTTILTVRECATDRAEAEFVAATIEQLVGGTSLTSLDTGRATGHEARACAFNDCAVLYRTDAQTGPLVEALARSGIPFQKRAHTSLANHPVVPALIAQLKLLPPDAPLAERLRIAAATLAKAETSDPDLRAITDALLPLAEKPDATLDSFINELTLGVDVDLHDARAERVSLLTLHAAKGLEFRVVFLVGCEDGLLPHRFSFDDKDDCDEAEERRLFFVGLTRARERLFLTHARRRHWRGELRDRYPSPFLRDISESLLARERDDPEARRRAKQLELFSNGIFAAESADERG